MYGGDGGQTVTMVPTRFTWPHGGRHVYLCGSFTRWQETIPMSPVEGAPSVFSTVLNLPPGYHQYKFIVDGEWRHDERQSQMPDPLGNVNNWLLVRDHEPLSMGPAQAAAIAAAAAGPVSPAAAVAAAAAAAGQAVEGPQTQLGLGVGAGVGASMDVDHMEVFHHSMQHLPSAAAVAAGPELGHPHSQPQSQPQPPPQQQVAGVGHNSNVAGGGGGAGGSAHVGGGPTGGAAGVGGGGHSMMADAVSAADAEASRQRISDFLLRHTAYELLPESGKVVALDVALPVKQAFHALYEQGVPAAPLWDSGRQEFVGMLSASDFIAIISQLRAGGASLSEEELETHTIAAWKEEKLAMAHPSDASHTPARRPLISVGPDDSMRRVAELVLQHSVATLPVLHQGPPEGSPPQLLHLASLSGILKCIARHFRHVAGSLPLLSQPLGALPVGTWGHGSGKATGRRHLATLRPNTPLTTALQLLLTEGVSSLPVVDDNGALMDVYARSDITALARDRAYTRLQLDEVSVSQALQYRQDAGATSVTTAAAGVASRCHMCLRSDTLRSVIDRLSLPGVRRLICVEAGSRRVEGIVSLTDIFQFLLA
eukprot:jgi/Mesen1/10724/ME000090S10182